MNHNVLRVVISLAFIYLGLGIAFSQGLTWETKTSTPIEGAQEINSVSYYRPHMFKQTSDSTATIFRLDKEMLIRVDDAKKEYSEMTFADLEAQMKQAGSAMDAQLAEMKKHLEKMPPEQRKMVEQMMGDKLKAGSTEAKVDVTKTSETKTISGYPCTKYVINDNGKEFATMWTTTSIPDFASMKDDFKKFSERMMAMIPSRGSAIATGMEQIDGFPIQTTIAGVTTTVSKVEKQSVPVSEFEVPSGYKKVKADFMKDASGEHGQEPDEEEQKEEE